MFFSAIKKLFFFFLLLVSHRGQNINQENNNPMQNEHEIQNSSSYLKINSHLISNKTSWFEQNAYLSSVKQGGFFLEENENNSSQENKVAENLKKQNELNEGLQNAVKSADLKQIKKLIQLGANPHYCNHHQQNLLHLAVSQSAEPPKKILNYLIQLNSTLLISLDENFVTPCRLAITNQHFKAAQVLTGNTKSPLTFEIMQFYCAIMNQISSEQNLSQQIFIKIYLSDHFLVLFHPISRVEKDLYADILFMKAYLMKQLKMPQKEIYPILQEAIDFAIPRIKNFQTLIKVATILDKPDDVQIYREKANQLFPDEQPAFETKTEYKQRLYQP